MLESLQSIKLVPWSISLKFPQQVCGWSTNHRIRFRIRFSDWSDSHKLVEEILTKAFEIVTKGQLISKCPFGFIVWTKLPTKLFLNFCPEIFCTFLETFWGFLQASLFMILLSPQEAQRAYMKPLGSYKKIQGRNPEIISLVFLSKQ